MWKDGGGSDRILDACHDGMIQSKRTHDHTIEENARPRSPITRTHKTSPTMDKDCLL
jgi:hypothetical protein